MEVCGIYRVEVMVTRVKRSTRGMVTCLDQGVFDFMTRRCVGVLVLSKLRSWKNLILRFFV